MGINREVKQNLSSIPSFSDDSVGGDFGVVAINAFLCLSFLQSLYIRLDRLGIITISRPYHPSNHWPSDCRSCSHVCPRGWQWMDGSWVAHRLFRRPEVCSDLLRLRSSFFFSPSLLTGFGKDRRWHVWVLHNPSNAYHVIHCLVWLPGLARWSLRVRHDKQLELRFSTHGEYSPRECPHGNKGLGRLHYLSCHLCPFSRMCLYGIIKSQTNPLIHN